MQASVDTSVSKKKRRRKKVIKKKTLSQSCFYSVHASEYSEHRGGNSLLGGEEEEEDEICQKRPELPIDWLTGTLVVNCCHLRWRGGGTSRLVVSRQGGAAAVFVEASRRETSSSGRFSFPRAPFVADSRVYARAVLSETPATYCSEKPLHNYIILNPCVLKSRGKFSGSYDN